MNIKEKFDRIKTKIEVFYYDVIELSQLALMRLGYSCLTLYDKVKPIVVKFYNKIKQFKKYVEKEIDLKKLFGRPLVIEYPLYVVKEAVIGFIDGAKRGIRLCRIKREQLNTEV